LSLWLRWWRFNAVGALGAVVQLAVLALLRGWHGMHLAPATALAVEAAIQHNYYCHRRWTWPDRRGSLLRFHLSNGTISLPGNVALTAAIASLGVHFAAANVLAIAVCAAANFLAAHAWAFRHTGSCEVQPGRETREEQRVVAQL
jgi:putative flippase GtrA